MAKRKKNYYVSEETIQKIKSYSESLNKNEGDVLDFFISFYERHAKEKREIQNEILHQLKEISAVQKRIEEDANLTLRLTDNWLLSENLPGYREEESVTLIEAREAYKREKKGSVTTANHKAKYYLRRN
ncbi:hypothetical protein F6353_002599 [Enterococcus faecium]|nr:hypothetical protein [Enterococcus faecium]EGP4808683.1 hypothetical protein [Enterococcus faecium]EME3510988.1 hypothetical protein [Enterococcus faecium]EME7093117.1 hypothetical protein [Enterococcus faecium]EME7094339.1 hypothetical protein [Enterococcus faecium]